MPDEPKHYRTCWISDIHLGTHGSNADALLEFLKHNEFDTLYLVGDILDIWAMQRGAYWPQTHNDVIQKLLRKGRKGCKIYYIPGNHDEFVADFVGSYGAIELVKNTIHTTKTGERILVMHGHEFDTVVQNMRWLAHVGDIGYKFLMSLNLVVNFFRRRFGMGYWSLSAYVKHQVKDVVSFIGKFEEFVVRYAKDFSVDSVLCGHIHTPACRRIGEVQYYNCGDWVESCSAIVEHEDGRIELLSGLYLDPARSAALARQGAEEEEEAEPVAA